MKHPRFHPSSSVWMNRLRMNFRNTVLYVSIHRIREIREKYDIKVAKVLKRKFPKG